MNDLASLVPQEITVVFKARGTGSPTSGVYSISVTLVELALLQFKNIVGAPWSRLLHRYEVAEYTGGASPDNLTDLEALAAQVASDWYLWQLGTLDIRYMGIAAWNPEGLHDIEWNQSGSKIVTRVYRRTVNPNEDLLYNFEVNEVDPSDTGILTINDNDNQHQTIGITDDIVFYPDSLGGLTENEMAVAPSIQTWVHDRLYMTGWIVGWAGRIWRATRASTESMPDDGNDDWVDVTDENLTLFHLPKARIYTPDANYAKAGVNYDTDPRVVPAGQNFKFKQVGNVAITSDGVSDEVTFTVPDGSIVIINETNIYNYDYSVNTLYFNIFNQTITIKYGDTLYFFYANCCENRKWYCMSADAQQACYNLLPSEYAQMIIDGYAYVSGPHDTQDVCLASCGAVPTQWWCLELTGVQGCYELTETELYTMLFTDGYTPIGRYPNQTTCNANCDIPPPITTDCCPDDPIPVTLYGVFSGAGSGCECMNGVPFTFTYDSGAVVWYANEKVIPACATIDGGNQLLLWCDAGTWNLDVSGVGNCPDPGFNVVTKVSCSPLVLTCTVSIINCGCGSVGTATLTITEVAP